MLAVIIFAYRAVMQDVHKLSEDDIFICVDTVRECKVYVTPDTLTDSGKNSFAQLIKIWRRKAEHFQRLLQEYNEWLKANRTLPVTEIIRKTNEVIARKYNTTDIIVDAPLLFEVGLDRICDKVIVIYAKYHLQLSRLMRRDNLSKEEATKRIALQMPIEDKMKLADITIDNSGTLAELKKNIKFIYKKLKNI